DPATLDRPTENPGWTVRNLAAHVAVGTDDFIKMCARPLSRGRNVMPVPIPAAVGRMIGNWTNARAVKKYRTAQPADLVAALDEVWLTGIRPARGMTEHDDLGPHGVRMQLE